MKSPVVHFEMPYKDADRVAEFYQKAFDWKMQAMGPDMGKYVVAVTGEQDEKTRRPKNPGEINGGFFAEEKADYKGTSVVISVDDIKEAMKSIEEAGGKILKQPDEIPGIGMWAVFEDTEGNRVSILQPKPMMDMPE